jgi:hypothetical protein
LFWIQRLNEALRIYDVLFIIPVFQVMWVTLSVVGGGIFFHEFEECFQGFTAFMFSLGLMTIFLGVFLLSPQPGDSPQAGIEDHASLISPLLNRDSILPGNGPSALVSTPATRASEASLMRSPVSPLSSASNSPSMLSGLGPNQLARTGSTLTFSLVTMPVVDAVEARDQRANSSANLLSSADIQGRSASAS